MCSEARARANTHTPKHTHTHSLSVTHALSHALSQHTHSHTHSLKHTLSPFLTHAHTHNARCRDDEQQVGERQPVRTGQALLTRKQRQRGGGGRQCHRCHRWHGQTVARQLAQQRRHRGAAARAQRRHVSALTAKQWADLGARVDCQ